MCMNASSAVLMTRSYSASRSLMKSRWSSLWLCRVREEGGFHWDSTREGGERGRKPMHQPSRIRTCGGEVGEVEGQVEGGRRSPWPEKADLSYCGIGVGVVGAVVREVRNWVSRGRSWVP